MMDKPKGRITNTEIRHKNSAQFTFRQCDILTVINRLDSFKCFLFMLFNGFRPVDFQSFLCTSNSSIEYAVDYELFYFISYNYSLLIKAIISKTF